MPFETEGMPPVCGALPRTRLAMRLAFLLKRGVGYILPDDAVIPKAVLGGDLDQIVSCPNDVLNRNGQALEP